MSDIQDDCITAAEVAETIGLSERQVNRYSSGPAPRLHTDRRGRHVFYHFNL